MGGMTFEELISLAQKETKVENTIEINAYMDED